MYDGWQSVARRNIGNNGKYVVLHTITPQEGDGNLVIQAAIVLIKRDYPADTMPLLQKTAVL